MGPARLGLIAVLPDQRRRQLAYRIKRRVVGAVDNEPVIEMEHRQAVLDAQRRDRIVRAARLRDRRRTIGRALGLAAALGVLALAIGVGALT